MSKTGLVGLCLIAVMGCAIATSSATAALPEIGRCEAVEKVQEGTKAHYHGAFANKTCTRPSSEMKGKYEWVSGPPTSKSFTTEITNSPTFETVNGRTVECQFGSLKEGEYTGPKTERFSSITLGDCFNEAGKTCQTDPELNKSVIEDVAPVEGELGVISGATSPTVGWELKGVLFVFVCGNEAKGLEVGEALTIEGAAIGVVTKKHGSDLDKMGRETRVEFEQAKGKQLPEAFEGGAAAALSTSRVKGVLPATEQTAFSATELDQYSEPLEIRTKE